MRHILTAALLSLVLAAPVRAQQEWPERFWFTVNGGTQAPATRSFSDTFDIQQFVETGHVTTHYPSKGGVLLDGSFGLRVGKRFGVGVGVTRASNTGSAGVSADIPHPFFDNQLRHIEGRTNVAHHELAAHVRFSYLVPVSRRLRISVSAGPSFFSVDQTLVTDVQYSQTFPFDSATFTGATSTRATATAVGFNAGGDVIWMLARRIGTGVALQYARATLQEKAGGSRTISVNGGGAQVGAGLRVFF
jgi:hypothetical protein